MNNQAERRQLCVEMEALKERLFRAELHRTAHKMNIACQEIGYECAGQFAREAMHEDKTKQS